MNRRELIAALADEARLQDQEATAIVLTFFDMIRQSLIDGGRVEIRGLGSFKTKQYRAYKGRNPKSGASVAVKPKTLPVFRSGKDLKEQVNRD